MPFRDIKLSMELLDIIEGLPKDILKELQTLGHSHIFPGRVIEKKDLRVQGDKYTLSRNWNGYDDFWEIIINCKSEEVNLESIIQGLDGSIRSMRKLRKRLLKLEVD